MPSTAMIFGAIIGGAIVIDYGVKNMRKGFASAASASSAASTSPSSSSTSSTPSSSSLPAGSQKQQVAIVAQQYGISPHTLWGIYGTESSFGTNPSTSSAGAQGPFQFLPSTWSGLGCSGSIQSFSDALICAAKLLKSNGADTDPFSSGTTNAIGRYYGAPDPTYIGNVHNFGSQF